MLDGHGNKIDVQRERQEKALRMVLAGGFDQQQEAQRAIDRSWSALRLLFGLTLQKRSC